MGMHFGLMAVRGSVAELVDSIPEIWPKFDIVATKDGFVEAEEIFSWKAANEQFKSAVDWTKDDPGREVYVVCQDGEWAVLMDFGYVLATDENALGQLSERFHSVVSFAIQTTSGCAFFWKYEEGEMKRTIMNADGEMTFAGDALPQEEGINTQAYYMEETELLMRAFGLSQVDQLLIPSTAIALAVVDRTDYSQLVSNANAAVAEAPAKPWWKFW